MKETDRLILSRNVGDRVLLGIFTPFVLAITGGLAWLFHPTGERLPFPTSIFVFIAFEIAFGFFSLGCLALLWAVAAPRFVEVLLQRTFRKVLSGIGVLAVGSIVYVIWMAQGG
ncbi:MAG: hypothetical protein C0404_14290 [Verrucomicrobia bacterium]|nr:hypothetical protein [Verrucomicrobiota bacterium]